jgi:hypothetical protein
VRGSMPSTLANTLLASRTVVAGSLISFAKLAAHTRS